MFKRFSFVGVSSAAVALAVLCPPPARALTFNWTFTSTNGNFTGPVSGTIDGLIDNTYNNLGNNSSMTATVTSDPFGIGGTPLQLSLNTGLGGGNGILVTAGVIDTTGLQVFFVSGNGSQTLQLENPNGNANRFAGYYSDSLAGSGSTAYSSYTPIPVFTAVPAPLPLLGLGAAAAFSRKLKQRIALKRKRDEVGAAI